MSKFKFTISSIYIFILLNISYSQTIQIIDQESSKPIAQVNIFNPDDKIFLQSDDNGYATITPFKESENIELNIIGYKPAFYKYNEFHLDTTIISMIPTGLRFGEVIVSAAKWKHISSRIPYSIHSINQKDVELYNPQTSADLLGLSGKVFIQKSQQGGGSPMIRGFATNRLLYTVDGVRMNTAIFRGGNIQNVINIDPFSVENTEIVMGSGSVLYGSDAIGGVMSFSTLNPIFSDSSLLVTGKASSRFSSANQEKSGHFDINIGTKKFASRTSISYWDFDNLKQGSNGPNDYIKPYYVSTIDSTDRVIQQEDPLLQIPTAYSQYNILQKFRYAPSSNLDLKYSFIYSETSPYGRYDRHNRVRNGLPRYAEWNYGPQKWMMNTLSATSSHENLFYDESIITLAYQKFEESRIDRNLNSNNRSIQKEYVDAYSLNFDLSKNLSSINTLSYGFEFVSNQVESTGNEIDITTNQSTQIASRYPNSNWKTGSIYLLDEHKLNDKFTFQAGIRYNFFDLKSSIDTVYYPVSIISARVRNFATTGSFGIVYRPSKDWVMKGNISTAFRAPNVDDIGKLFDSEPGAVVVPNPYLSSEYAYNYDFGMSKIFGDKFKLDFNLFYSDLKDALVRRDFTLNGQDSILYKGEMSKVQAIQNAANLYVYGFRLGIDVQLIKHISYDLNISFQNGKEEMDDQSISFTRHAAPIFGNTGVNFKNKKVEMKLYVIFQGEKPYSELNITEQSKDEIYAKDANGQNYAPAWYTLNLKANCKLNKVFILGVGLENITDQRYRPYSSGISGAGRNFIMSMTAKF